MKPLIVDIKRHSLEDGPGIRTSVFFKGCPLRCIFCHNPESQKPHVELKLSIDHCINCKSCIDICPQDALSFDNSIVLDTTRCNHCGLCAERCPGNGIRTIGTYYTETQLTEILLRDTAYFTTSGGGVTFSGGECLLYPRYLNEVAQQLKKSNIHIALQTSGYFDYDECAVLFKKVDCIYYDIKIFDREKHELYTGVFNNRILENFNRIMTEFEKKVIPGISIIPGITATHENLLDIITLFKKNNVPAFYVHPFNPSGINRESTNSLHKNNLSHFMSLEDELAFINEIKNLIFL